MKQLHARKLVTVVCESALEARVLETLREAGAGGYTLADVRGGGARGVRAGDWEGGRSVEIQVLCDEPTAQRLYASLRELDGAGCEAILVEAPPETPEWAGVRDRLERAAG